MVNHDGDLSTLFGGEVCMVIEDGIGDNTDVQAILSTAYTFWPEAVVEWDDDESGIAVGIADVLGRNLPAKSFFVHKTNQTLALWNEHGCVEGTEETMVYVVMDNFGIVLTGDYERLIKAMGQNVHAVRKLRKRGKGTIELSKG